MSHLINIFRSNSRLQLFTSCSFPRGTDILDLFFTNAPETTGVISCIEGFSDHKLIHFQINLPVMFTGAVTKAMRDYNRGDYDKFNTDLEIFYHEYFLPSFVSRTVNTFWILFQEKILELVDQYINLLVISNNNTNPWFTKQLQTWRNKKKRSYILPQNSMFLLSTGKNTGLACKNTV